MLSEQQVLANRTKDFLNRWGLKAKYVAEVCCIHEKVFSKFTNHHVTLSKSQLQRLTGYMAEYEERMKPIAPKNKYRQIVIANGGAENTENNNY